MLFCSDYDRTLRIENEISKEVREAIKEFQSKGHLFCINTGRNFYNMKEELEEKKFHCDYVIAGSGSQIFDHNDTMMVGFRYQKEVAKTVIQEIFRTNSLSIVIGEATRHVFHWKEHCPIWDERLLQVDVDEIYAISTRFQSTHEATAFQRHIEAVCGVSAYVNRTAVDIVMKDVSKATGIDALRKQRNIEIKDIYVIGDGTNDIAMVEAYRGFCVDHGEEALKRVATRSFGDVGACIRYLLDR